MWQRFFVGFKDVTLENILFLELRVRIVNNTTYHKQNRIKEICRTANSVYPLNKGSVTLNL